MEGVPTKMGPNNMSGVIWDLDEYLHVNLLRSR